MAEGGVILPSLITEKVYAVVMRRSLTQNKPKATTCSIVKR